MSRLLLVEDSPTQAHHLALILEDAGFEVALAPDADRGFEQLNRVPFDLVLSDLLLPGDSGFDLCRRIKTDPRFGRIPVVVLTSQADPANVLRGLEAGADGFMTKDREPEEVVRGIQRILARAAADDNGAPLRVAFLDQEYQVAAGRSQLVNVLVSAFEDVVRLNESEGRALQRLKQTQSQLVQAEKLSSLGQLVAGVAHEINNPLSFVSNNVAVLQRDVLALRDLVALYREAEGALRRAEPELLERVHARQEEFDLSYTLDNLERLLERSRVGLGRIQQIVRDLQDFARFDADDFQEVDVNAGIESTVNIIRGHAERQQVTVAAELTPVPRVAGHPARLNQVVLNLLTNAIDASTPGKQVAVTTQAVGTGVEIRVADEGCGIDPSIRDRIFDPFFTTKPVGKGTGLGLSITYGIVRAHGGRIDVESTPGKGACFIVRLPAAPSPAGRAPRP